MGFGNFEIGLGLTMEKLNQEREVTTNSNSQMGGENPRKKSMPTALIECHYFMVVYTLPLKLELVPTTHILRLSIRWTPS